jgi:hypothetical protein
MTGNQRKRPRGIIPAIFLVFFFIFPVFAAATGPGTSAATFLDLGFGARPLGFGEAYVAMADDVSAVHYNPAGLSLPQPAMRSAPGAYEMLFTHTQYIQGVALDQLGLVRRPWGLSVTNLRVGGIEGRTLETDAPSNFGASDLAVGLSYGRQVGPVGLGATFKYINESIGSASASSFAVDLGALHRFESSPVSVGVDLANFGKPIRFIDQSSPLPLVLRTGVTYGQTKSFPHALSLQLDWARDSGPIVRLGAEYAGFGPFALRIGYRTFGSGQRDAVLGKTLGSTSTGFSGFYGLFLGAGLQTKIGNLDYAILPFGELGLAHRLSLGLRFGGPSGKSGAGK